MSKTYNSLTNLNKGKYEALIFFLYILNKVKIMFFINHIDSLLLYFTRIYILIQGVEKLWNDLHFSYMGLDK